MRTTTSTLGLALALSLGVFMLLAPQGESSSPTPAVDASVVSWAFLGDKVNSTANVSASEVFSTHYHVTVVTIANQTNTSATMFKLQISRAVNAVLFVDFCSPDCNAPSVRANVTIAETEVLNAVENFTTNGNMHAGNLTVSADALESSYGTVRSNLTETSLRQFSALGHPSAHNSTAYVSEQFSGAYSLILIPPLGIFPESQLSGSQPAVSHSNYTLTGDYSGSYHYLIGAGFNGSISVSKNGTVPLTQIAPPSGSVTMVSIVAGSASLPGGTVPTLNMSVTGGPFVMVDGVLVPEVLETFSAGTNARWFVPPEMPGVAVSATDRFDLSGSVSGHVGLLATRTMYMASIEIPVTGSTGPLTTDVVSTEVQGQPTSTTTAWRIYNGISSEVAPPVGSISASGPPLTTWSMIGAVAAIVAMMMAAGVAKYGKRGKGGPPVNSPGLPVPPAQSQPLEAQDHPLENIW